MRSASLSFALVAAIALTLSACGSGSSGSDGAASKATTTTTVADDGPQIVVRVVADSEVPDGVSTLLDQEPGIEVASMLSADGAKMEQLDESVDNALAEEPDVLVYSGGTNDLGMGGLNMLEALKERLTRYGQETCVVMAVPVFRYERGTADEVAERTKGTRILEDGARSTGAKVASYLDVSLAMDEEGEDFFAPGELGDMHPGDQSHAAIAAAIAEQVRACAGG